MSLEPENLVNVFNSFFGEPSSSKPEDINQLLYISPAEAQNGCTRLLSYTARQYCGNCSSSGDAIEGAATLCSNCNGAGAIVAQRNLIFGTLQTRKSCKKCKGVGRIIKDPCAHCGGKGFFEVQERLEITIPSDFKHQNLIYPNKGHYIDKTNRGDLIVMIALTK